MPEPVDFEAVYRADPDPFSIATSFYEQRKIRVVTSSLQQATYRFGWDVACGTGHLVHELANRCERLLATDASATAVRITASRLADQPHVETAGNVLPAMPDRVDDVDLVIAAEVLYYVSDADRTAAVRALTQVGQELVVVNWRHHPADGYLSGAAAIGEVDQAARSAGWRRSVTHDEDDFVLGIWNRTGDE